MNNKFIARVAAVAIGAAMLSSAAFATDPTIDKTEGSLNVTGAYTPADDQEYVTMMAYAVADETVADAATRAYAEGDEMIALEQVAKATGLTTIGFDTSKVTDKKNVIVKIGGGNSVASFVLPLSVTSDFTRYFEADSTLNEITVGGTTYTNVMAVTATCEPALGEKVEKVGVIFANYNTDRTKAPEKNGEKELKTIDVAYEGTELEISGKLKYGIAIIGIPDDAVKSGVYAFPYAIGKVTK